MTFAFAKLSMLNTIKPRMLLQLQRIVHSLYPRLEVCDISLSGCEVSILCNTRSDFYSNTMDNIDITNWRLRGEILPEYVCYEIAKTRSDEFLLYFFIVTSLPNVAMACGWKCAAGDGCTAFHKAWWSTTRGNIFVWCFEWFDTVGKRQHFDLAFA